MSAEQWAGAEHVGFGVGNENLLDSWPSSSLSPGVSPQPSPDSQLLEPVPVPASESTQLSDKNLCSTSNQHVLPPPNYQQSPIISQSNQPVPKDSQQSAHDKRNCTYPESQPMSKADGPRTFPKPFVSPPNVMQARPAAVVHHQSQQSPQKGHFKNVTGPSPLPPSQSLSQNSIPSQSVRPARPNLSLPGAQQTRPPAIQQLAPNQRGQNPIAGHQSFRPRIPSQNLRPPQRVPQHQQHQFQQNRYPSNPTRQPGPQQSIHNQSSLPRHSHPQPPQLSGPNPPFSNQRLPPRLMPQTPIGQPPPMGPRPRLMVAPVQQQIQSQPGQPRPTMVRPPHLSNMNQQNTQRFTQPGQMRPTGIHDTAGQAYDEDYDEYDEEDEDDEDMYYDEEEDYARGSIYNQQQRLDYPLSESSEESEDDGVLLEELANCDDQERAEIICQKLREKGVPEEEIEDVKMYGLGEDEDMDYDDEMDEDHNEEDMVSSSSMTIPRSSHLIPQQQQPHQRTLPPPQNKQHVQNQGGVPVNTQEQSGNLPQPHAAGHRLPQTFSPSEGQKQPPRPQVPASNFSNRPPRPVTHQTPPPQRISGNFIPPPMSAANVNSESFQRQSSEALPQPHHGQQQQHQKPLAPPSSTLQSQSSQSRQAPLQTSPSKPMNIAARGTVGPSVSTPRMPSPASSSPGQFSQQSTTHCVNLPSPVVQQSQPRPIPHSGNTAYPSVQQTPIPPGARPSPRHPAPVHGPHFSQPPQTQQPYFHGQHRMPAASVRLKSAVVVNTPPPTDAVSAREAVEKMQRILDAEIMAKKRPHSQPTGAFPVHHQTHPMMGPGNQAIRSPLHQPATTMVRHKLPPRTPIPHMPPPRPMTPASNFNDQQVPGGGNPRFQGQRGPGFQRPRHPGPPSLPVGVVGPSQSPNTNPNQYNNPIPAQSKGVSYNSTTPQHTTTSTAGMRMPGPAASQGQFPSPSQPTGQQPRQHSGKQPGHSQTPQPNAPKPGSFKLEGLSEDKCIVKGSKGNSRLMINSLYQIRSPIDQTLVLARWNGESFEDITPEEKELNQAGVVTPSAAAPQTSVMANEQPSTSSVADTSTAGQTSAIQVQIQAPGKQLNPNGQTSANQVQVLAPGKQPTPKNNDKKVEDEQTSIEAPPKENVPDDKKAKEQEEENDDEFIFKKPLNDNEDYYRVCKHCGYTSKNFKRCEGCKRVFQGEIKIHSKRKPNATELLPSPSSSSQCNNSSKNDTPKSISRLEGWTDKKRSDQDHITLQPKSPGKFYGGTPPARRGQGGRKMPAGRGVMGRTRGGGLTGRMGFGMGGDEYDSSDSEDPFDRRNISDSSLDSQPGKKRMPRGRGKNPGSRKRSKKSDEPVTVMISSDEDEPSSTSNSFMGIPPPRSPASSAGSGSPIFSMTPKQPSGAFGRFRRYRMEDAEGNSKLGKKIESDSIFPMEDDDDDDDDEGDEPPTYQIEIRSVRVGSMRTKPEGPLFINMRGVCFRVKSERTDELYECEIMTGEVEHVKYYGGQGQPLLFMLLTQECGEKLRTVFRMEEGGDEYLDPSSTDMKQKMVVIIIESLDYLPQDMRETLSLWADVNSMPDAEYIEELTEESANDLLIQSAPPVLTADLEHQMVSFKKGYMKTERSAMLMPRAGSPFNAADNEPDSTSSSPPQPTELRKYFEGPTIRLLQYPPPPARGIAITTEDLFCLTEGEFLNDVIIDFYLQYLHQELLTEEMRKRTHVFSSFFYKRLTQKDREKTEEDAKKTLPERRHARVKKWTKTVDLFSKDFIIVPINEHSHWYLAVICFPGMLAPEVVPFLPSTQHRGEVDDSNNGDGESQEDGGAEEGSSSQPDPTVKTVFGRQLDPKKCVESDENNFCLGQKQPCILMFDSLLGPSRNPNVKMLRDYLQCEWNAKQSEPRSISKILRGSTPKVPQQSNYSDCGIYLLQYVESFFEDPIADFQIPMKGLQHWFTEDLIVNKREDIHNLIMKLHRRFQEGRGDSNILDIKYEFMPPHPSWAPPAPSTPPMSLRPLLPQDQFGSEDSADGQEINGLNRRDGDNQVRDRDIPNPPGTGMDSGDSNSNQSASLPGTNELQQNSSTSVSPPPTPGKDLSSSESPQPPALALSSQEEDRDIPRQSFFDHPPALEEEQDGNEHEVNGRSVEKMEVENEDNDTTAKSSIPCQSEKDGETLSPHVSNNIENGDASVVSDVQTNLEPVVEDSKNGKAGSPQDKKGSQERNCDSL